MLAGCDIPIFTNGVSRDGVDLSVMHACMFFVKFFMFVCQFVVVVLLFQHNLFVYGVVLNSKTFLTLCTLGNCSCFCCRLLTFFKIVFFRVSNGSDPNCLQLSADDKSHC